MPARSSGDAPELAAVAIGWHQIVCPNCKAAYDLGVKIEPVYPEAGKALKAAGLIAGVFILIGVVADILRGGKRRRRGRKCAPTGVH